MDLRIFNAYLLICEDLGKKPCWCGLAEFGTRIERFIETGLIEEETLNKFKQVKERGK